MAEDAAALKVEVEEWKNLAVLYAVRIAELTGQLKTLEVAAVEHGMDIGYDLQGDS